MIQEFKENKEIICLPLVTDLGTSTEYHHLVFATNSPKVSSGHDGAADGFVGVVANYEVIDISKLCTHCTV